MTAEATIRSTAGSVIAGASRCATAAGAISTVIALLVVVTGAAPDTRRALGFGFGGVERSLAEASWIAVHNAKVAAATLACAAAAPRLPRLARVPVDLLFATLLALSAGSVGVAFGAYGWRALSATAAHLPLELAGLSLAGGAYLHARRQPLPARALTAVGAGCAVLLAAAALLETYVSPGATG